MTLSDNSTTYMFEGITFSFSYPCNLAANPLESCAKVTPTIVSCTTEPTGYAIYCQGTLPQIEITFSDGKVEYFNEATTINGVVTYDRPASYPWFSVHSTPRVGIEFDKNHAPPDTLLLMVST